MLNNLITYGLGQKKYRKILLQAVISVKYFYIIVEIRLSLQYEPGSLEVNKVCFVK